VLKFHPRGRACVVASGGSRTPRRCCAGRQPRGRGVISVQRRCHRWSDQMYDSGRDRNPKMPRLGPAGRLQQGLSRPSDHSQCSTSARHSRRPIGKPTLRTRDRRIRTQMVAAPLPSPAQRRPRRRSASHARSRHHPPPGPRGLPCLRGEPPHARSAQRQHATRGADGAHRPAAAAGPAARAGHPGPSARRTSSSVPKGIPAAP